MKVASVADVKAKLSAYMKAADQGPIVITKNGKAVAAIIALADDDDVERLMLSFSPKLRGILDAGRRQAQRGEVLTHEEVWGKKAARRGKSR